MARGHIAAAATGAALGAMAWLTTAYGVRVAFAMAVIATVVVLWVRESRQGGGR